MTDTIKENLEKIIRYYGKEPQMIVAIEELAELQKEITKRLRPTRMTVFGLVEEIADVEVMINQLKLIFGISEAEIARERDYKINRTLERIEKERKKHEQR